MTDVKGNGSSAGGPPEDENKLIAERRGKLAQLREAAQQSGTPVFPNDFRRNALAEQLHDAFGERDGAWLDANPTQVSVGGRILFKRVMGKASFVKIADRTGQIQLFLQQEALGAAYEAFKSWDVGDIIGATGALFRTKTNELSVRADSLRLLVKALRPLPDKWHGLADNETRYRQRTSTSSSTRRAGMSSAPGRRSFATCATSWTPSTSSKSRPR